MTETEKLMINTRSKNCEKMREKKVQDLEQRRKEHTMQLMSLVGTQEKDKINTPQNIRLTENKW